MKKLLSAVAVTAIMSLSLPLTASTAAQGFDVPAMSAPAVNVGNASSVSGGSTVSVLGFVSLPLAAITKKKSTKLSSSSLNGKTVKFGALERPVLKGKAASGNSGREIVLQKYSTKSKKWSTVEKKKIFSDGSFWFQLPQSGTTSSMRYHIPATKSHYSYTSPKTSVQRTKYKSKTYTTYLDYERTVPWQKNTLSTWIDVGYGVKATVQLQEKRSGKSWKVVGTHKNFTGGDLSWTLPKGKSSSADEKIQYKIVTKSNSLMAGSNSKTFNVQWDNPHKGSAQEKKVFSYIKKYCPDTTVIMSKSLNDDGSTWGLANMGPNLITIWTGVPNVHLKTVALHECAHQQQWKVNDGNWSGFVSKMNKAHKTSGVLGMERNAHCIAHQWSKNSYWIYGATEKICTTGESGKAARALAAGKRY